MTMLVRLQRQASITPDLNPLKIVQVLLGHSSIHYVLRRTMSRSGQLS
jgi:hypothetical protein